MATAEQYKMSISHNWPSRPMHFLQAVLLELHCGNRKLESKRSVQRLLAPVLAQTSSSTLPAAFQKPPTGYHSELCVCGPVRCISIGRILPLSQVRILSFLHRSVLRPWRLSLFPLLLTLEIFGAGLRRSAFSTSSQFRTIHRYCCRVAFSIRSQERFRLRRIIVIPPGASLRASRRMQQEWLGLKKSAARILRWELVVTTAGKRGDTIAAWTVGPEQLTSQCLWEISSNLPAPSIGAGLLED